MTEHIQQAQGSAEHLLGLINTILDIAKIEVGRMDVITSTFHIGRLIEATATMAQPLLKPGVTLHVEIEDGLPEIISDQDKIKQILLNLLSNAAKFTHEGETVISCELRVMTLHLPLATRNSYDSGIGMSEDALSRIFEAFQQADSTTTREYGGTGLGLSISKHLAQLLGGDLTAASEVGGGSTFTLVLPVEAVNS